MRCSLRRWLAHTTARNAIAMVGSALQPWPTLHCSVEKQNFCFFLKILVESFKRQKERERKRRAKEL